MTAPSYTTDLSTFNLCENSGTFGEFTGMADGGTPVTDSIDDPIQGTYHVSAQCSLKVSEIQSLYADYGSGVTIPTDGAILIWSKFDAGGLLGTYDNGGVRIVVGTSASVWSAWKAGGVDKSPNPYGGWYNYAINPTARTRDYNAGTISTYNLAGMAIIVTAAGPTKGEPYKMDALRYGRGSIIFQYGSSGDGYATFTQAAIVNDDNSATYGYNKWGLFQAVSGGYLWKGRMQIGTSSNACEFDDSDAFILIDDVVNCTAYFNTLEINHADTIVNWENVIIKALGTTSPGRLVMNHNADMNISGCQFFDMGDFGFGGTLSEFLICAWSGCGQIDVNGGKLNGSQITGCIVDGAAADEAAVIWNVNVDPDGYLDDLTITKGSATNHAIEFGDTIPSSLTLRNCAFSGYNSSGSQYDSTFYFADTTGTFTLNLVACSGNVTVKTAGCTVTVVEDPVTVKATCVKTDGSLLQNVRVIVKAKAKSTGTATTDTTNKLVDTNATFQADGIAVDDVAFNQTDGTSASVTAIDSETSLSLNSDAFPDGNEDYRVGGAFPVEDTVTIANSGTTATVTHTGHGMATNDYVYIEGGTLVANEGVFQITYINANSYSYTMGSTPGSSPTGTITSTFVALTGLSDVNGVVSTSRVYTVDQPISGWARNTVGGSPYYKEGPVTGTVDASDGLISTAVLVSDE